MIRCRGAIENFKRAVHRPLNRPLPSNAFLFIGEKEFHELTDAEAIEGNSFEGVSFLPVNTHTHVSVGFEF